MCEPNGKPTLRRQQGVVGTGVYKITCYSFLAAQSQSSGEGNGNPLQYSCLENFMDRGAWWATVNRVCRVAKSQTRLKQLSMHACVIHGLCTFLIIKKEKFKELVKKTKNSNEQESLRRMVSFHYLNFHYVLVTKRIISSFK